MKAHSFKELLEITGLNLTQFAERYNIPYRTCQNWSSNVSAPPEYVLELLDFRIQSDLKQVKENGVMKKFEIRKNQIEIEKKNAKNIQAGCSMDQNETFPTVVKSFDTKEEALEALKSYHTEIRDLNSYYLVTEFYVEENEYDEDGDWLDGGDIWAFTDPIIEVSEKPSYNTVGTFNNMAAALDFLSSLEDGFISFK